jgi:hypothetical protein
MEIARLGAVKENPTYQPMKWETTAVGEFLSNPIQIWKMRQDGSVQDALFNTFKV